MDDDFSLFELQERLEMKLAHLDAILTMTWGEGGETFRMHNRTVQDNFMWAASSLAQECIELFGNLRQSISELKTAARKKQSAGITPGGAHRMEVCADALREESEKRSHEL